MASTMQAPGESFVGSGFHYGVCGFAGVGFCSGLLPIHEPKPSASDSILHRQAPVMPASWSASMTN